MALLVVAGGLALLWIMWRSGGDFWRDQRPYMMVTLGCASLMIVAIALAVCVNGTVRTLLILGAIIAALATFLGEGLADRGRFERLRLSLEREVDAVRSGGDCNIRCRIDSREPLRVAFLLSGTNDHWSGACYDATDQIQGAELTGRAKPLSEAETAMNLAARAMFGGQVRSAPKWTGHWFGCSTRP